MDPPVYAKAIQAARKLFDFAESVGYHFQLLDIGGGFPGDNDTDIKEVHTRTHTHILSHQVFSVFHTLFIFFFVSILNDIQLINNVLFKQIASIVNHSIDLHFPLPDVTIIAEPGRFYVSSAYTLACRVHSKREVRQNGKFNSVMYYINDGVYGSFNCNLYDHKIVYPITLKPANEELFKSSIWGPTCDALDQVCTLYIKYIINISIILMRLKLYLYFSSPNYYYYRCLCLPSILCEVGKKHGKSE